MVPALPTAAAAPPPRSTPGRHRAGQAIRAWRRRQQPRWSAERFALHYGVSLSQVYRFETGERLAPMALALQLDRDGVCPLAAWGEPAAQELAA